MKEPRGYADALFARRLAYYREHRRTRLPHQTEAQTCLRVNRLVLRPSGRLRLSETEDGLPFDLFDRDFRFDVSSQRLFFIGSGGEASLAPDRCVVAAAHVLLQQRMQLSCGECSYCRVGTQRMSEMLGRIRSSDAQPGDLERLEELAQQVHAASLCEVGRSAALPVLATLRHFRTVYVDHARRHRSTCRLDTCRAEEGGAS